MLTTIFRNYCLFVTRFIWFIGRSVSFLLPVLAAVVAFEVFCRYVLNAPTIWAYDTSLFIFGYISALGGAYAQQKKSHINIDILFLKVPATIQRIFNLITITLAVGLLLVMVNVCFAKFLECLEFGFRKQSEWAPQVSHFWLMMTVSAGIFIAQYSADFIGDVYFLLTRKELIIKENNIPHGIIEPTATRQPDNADTKIKNALAKEDNTLIKKDPIVDTNMILKSLESQVKENKA